MASELILEIVTPFGEVFNEPIVRCTLPGAAGQFQVLKGHAALMSTIEIGSVKIEFADAKPAFAAVSSGFCEVKEDRVKIIVESAEFSGNIDVARAEASKKRAEERLSLKSAELDNERAKASLMRALNRLKVSRFK